MLSSENARILLHVKENGNIVFSDELPDFFNLLRAEYLVDIGYLHYTCDSSGFAAYQLLPAGEDALSEFAEEERRRAERKENANRQNQLQDKRWRKDAQRSWVQWAVTTIIAIATFFAGAMFEANTSFIEWVSSLLH